MLLRPLSRYITSVDFRRLSILGDGKTVSVTPDRGVGLSMTFPNETSEYRAARDALLVSEIA